MYVLTIALSRLIIIKKRAVRHIKRIALGVPEDKVGHLRFSSSFSSFVIAYYRAQWDALFDEISRVMKPGAAFEVRQ